MERNAEKNFGFSGSVDPEVFFSLCEGGGKRRGGDDEDFAGDGGHAGTGARGAEGGGGRGEGGSVGAGEVGAD